MYKISLILIFLIAILGNDILKISMAGIPSILILLYSFASIIYIFTILIKRKIRIRLKQKLLNFLLLIFIILTLFYLFISLLGYINLFNIDGFFLKRNYILRHALFVFCIPIYLATYLSLKINEVNILKYLNSISYLTIHIVLFITYFLKLTGLNSTQKIGLVVILLFFILIQLKKPKQSIFSKIWYYILSLISLLLSPTSANIMIYIMFIIFSISNYKFIKMLSDYKIYLLIAAFILIILVILNYNILLNYMKIHDANSWWRLEYWKDNFETLVQTKFFGVGFGTPFGKSNLFNIMSGGWIDPETGLSSNDIEILYITAQHNSIINIFYRLGAISGMIFITLILNTINLLIKNYLRFNRNIYPFIFVIIGLLILLLFDPVLESPQLFLPLLFPFIYVLYYINNIGN